jgi:hypothetical protein
MLNCGWMLFTGQNCCTYTNTSMLVKLLYSLWTTEKKYDHEMHQIKYYGQVVNRHLPNKKPKILLHAYCLQYVVFPLCHAKSLVHCSEAAAQYSLIYFCSYHSSYKKSQVSYPEKDKQSSYFALHCIVLSHTSWTSCLTSFPKRLLIRAHQKRAPKTFLEHLQHLKKDRKTKNWFSG